MPYNMSFALTTEQVLKREKHVTRRLGWGRLKPEMLVNAVRKCMGMKKGEKIERLALIQIVSVRLEPLSWMIDDPEYGANEARLEGFPGMTGAEFVEMFCRHMKVTAERKVYRVEFRYPNSQ